QYNTGFMPVMLLEKISCLTFGGHFKMPAFFYGRMLIEMMCWRFLHFSEQAAAFSYMLSSI
ncbi:hypothetical protein, partial [Bacillus sp. TH008]|uniref:hypothetical protein n=1 Tax=Bacillus sp. TH008 TaxID=1609979 RepID=UPI001F295B78